MVGGLPTSNFHLNPSSLRTPDISQSTSTGTFLHALSLLLFPLDEQKGECTGRGMKVNQLQRIAGLATIFLHMNRISVAALSSRCRTEGGFGRWFLRENMSESAWPFLRTVPRRSVQYRDAGNSLKVKRYRRTTSPWAWVGGWQQHDVTGGTWIFQNSPLSNNKVFLKRPFLNNIHSPGPFETL